MKEKLTMTFAGGLIKHLGLQMYSGPVPSIAELVANAWDAMAKKVEITMPTNATFESADQIIVQDDGVGMTYEECRTKYLVVGRDRRSKEGDYAETRKGMKKRRVMSRKGIGKLAGFGIAQIVDVRTVKDGVITHFEMDFAKMTDGKYVQEYEPVELADSGTKTNEASGTRITLKNLKPTKAVNEDSFVRSMTRRFTVLADPEFSVFVNGKKTKKTEAEFQFRYPERSGKWNEEEVEGAGKVHWWIGFTEKPIPDDEARGIVVFARGKLVQAPWFFDISGGAYGQHGMQYMTGEVVADFLDLTEGEDLVATDRASVLWDEDITATNLRNWGQAKVRELLRDWAERRSEDKKARPEIKKYLAYGESLPPREREIFRSYIEKITSIPQIDEDEDILDELARFGYNALTNQHFFDMIRQINAASPQDTARIGEVLAEWDIVEAISAAQQVKGRVEIIRKFRSMIEEGVPEKPDMQDYIMQHPWLIDPAWAPLKHEKSMDTILAKEFKTPKTKTKEGRERPDYFCLASANQCQVVDLKRPQIKVGRDELQQIQGYVAFLREESKKTSVPEMKMHHVSGILIYSDIANNVGTLVDSLERDGIRVMRWDDVLRRTERLHEDYLNVVKARAPEGDPRIASLEQLDQEETSKKTSARVTKPKKATRKKV